MAVRRKRSLFFSLILFFCFCYLNGQIWNFLTHKLPYVTDVAMTRAHTLVIFAYHSCGQICDDNLKHFVTTAVWPNSGADYVLVVSGECQMCRSLQRELQNVYVTYKPNEGYDFGAYRYVLDRMDLSAYRHFVFVNDGMRGPLLPSYQWGTLRFWYKHFTSLLNEQVKLVGPTISCELQLHVQSSCFATDRVGLDLFMQNNVFPTNISSFRDLIDKSELGMTSIIMNNGYTVSSLMSEYANWDWRDIWMKNKGKNACNDGANPTVRKSYHGDDLNPYEIIMFKRGGTVRTLCPKRGCDSDKIVDTASKYMQEYAIKQKDTVNRKNVIEQM